MVLKFIRGSFFQNSHGKLFPFTIIIGVDFPPNKESWKNKERRLMEGPFRAQYCSLPPSCGKRQVYVELVHERLNDYHYDYNITSDSCQ